MNADNARWQEILRGIRCLALEMQLLLLMGGQYSCCSGDSTMEVIKLLMKAGGQDIYLEFVRDGDCRRAKNIIDKANGKEGQ